MRFENLTPNYCNYMWR